MAPTFKETPKKNGGVKINEPGSNSSAKKDKQAVKPPVVTTTTTPKKIQVPKLVPVKKPKEMRVASDDEYDDESEPEPEQEVRQPKGNRAQRVNGPAPMTRGSKADSSCWSS